MNYIAGDCGRVRKRTCKMNGGGCGKMREDAGRCGKMKEDATN